MGQQRVLLSKAYRPSSVLGLKPLTIEEFQIVDDTRGWRLFNVPDRLTGLRAFHLRTATRQQHALAEAGPVHMIVLDPSVYI